MIRFEHVTKTYRQGDVVRDVNLEIRDGELVVLAGPSGCGKTTTLKMINQLIRPSGGRILIDGRDIAELDAVRLRRGIGYVIQKTGLFPHMTVKENIEIVLRMQGIGEPERERKVSEMLRVVHMDPDRYLYRYPAQLSGGQQQRVGVARAFAGDPKIILMDEPFSALDPITRSRLQAEVAFLQKKLKKTIVFVTHEMDEAVRLADRICIIYNGRIAQYDTPETILKHPADGFIANFVGKGRIWDTPRFIRVGDIMIRCPVSCAPEASLADCGKLLRESRSSAVAVTDSDRRILGIVRASDVWNREDPDEPVRKIMTEDFSKASPDQTLPEILRVVLDRRSDFVPVEDGRNKLVGLITEENLLCALSRKFLGKGEKEAGWDDDVSC